jgi:uncharacterized membrane protein YdjX (TVP38/TMEM64 family)
MELRTIDLLKLAAFFSLQMVGLIVLATPGGRGMILEWAEWAKEHQEQAIIAYIGLFSLGAILHLPEVILAVLAGYVFSNYILAVLATAVGATCGAILAFGLGRFLIRDIVALHVLPRFETLAVLDRAAGSDRSWMVALFIRLPFVPYVPLNFALSATSLPFSTYVWTSFVGLLPGSALYVFVGRGMSNISDFLNGKESNPASMAFSIVGILISVVSFIFLARYANRMVQEENSEYKNEDEEKGLVGGWAGVPGPLNELPSKAEC